MTTGRATWDVFVAYASADRDVARELERALTREGLVVCRDETAVLPGQRWQEVLPEHIRRSRCVVVLVSVRSPAATYLNDEIALAIAERDRGGPLVVPITLEPQAALPYGLLTVQALAMHHIRSAPAVAAQLAQLLAPGRAPSSGGPPPLGPARRGVIGRAVSTFRSRRVPSIAAVAALAFAGAGLLLQPWADDDRNDASDGSQSPRVCRGFAMTVASTEGRDDGESVVLRLTSGEVGISVGAQSNLQFVYDNGVTKSPLAAPSTWGDSFELPASSSVSRMVVAPVPGWSTVVLRGSDPLGPDTTECPVDASR